jgi:DNA-directed RNA polymerase specialized sigma24 family protein
MGTSGTTELQQPRVTARRDFQKGRFETYFPRVFAYALSASGNDETARRITINAFAEAFSLPDMREPDFEIEMFRIARGLARISRSQSRNADGLTGRERDVISLVFDAQLQRDQVGSLLSLRPETVLGIMLKGLRKLRDPMPANAAPPAIPEMFRA